MSKFSDFIQDRIDVTLPAYLYLNTAIEFNTFIATLPIATTIVFDCSRIEFVEPYPMLLVSFAIREFIRKRPETTFYQRGINHGYAKHMGFFETAGLLNGRGSDKRGNPHYLAITEISCVKLFEDAYASSRHPNDLAQEHAEEVAYVLSQKNQGNAQRIIKYSIQELLRNVIEHSESKNYIYAAQHWPKKDLVEIAILDTGIGLKRSLEKNPTLTVPSDIEALNMAITPGVTSSYYTTPPKGTWFNAGFGLYMMSRLCGEGGSFTIISGSFGLIRHGNNTKLFQANGSGTSVRLILRPTVLNTMENAFERYGKEAEQISKNIRPEHFGLSPSTILTEIAKIR